MVHVPIRELQPDEPLTQYGRVTDTPSFRRRPRTETSEREISVIIGELTVEDAASYVRISGKPARRGGNVIDIVRHTTVGALRRAGFHVYHSPVARNPFHAQCSAAGNGPSRSVNDSTPASSITRTCDRHG